jgi:small subunit ribosomal protein S6
MYIVHPALEAGRLKDLIVSVESTVKDFGGKTHTIEAWGKKKLAYPINKEKYGMYVLFQFESDGTKNKDLNTTLDHNTNVLAYLTTKIDKNQLLEEKSSLDNQLGLINKDESKPTEATKEKISNDTAKVESSKTTESGESESTETEEKKEEN